MAIPAQRFKSLSAETNVPVVDFSAITNSDIYNSANAALTEVSDSLKGLLETAKQQFAPIQAEVTDAEAALTRATKDVFSTLKDVSGFDAKTVEAEIADMLPAEFGIQNMFKQLTKSCRDSGMSQNPGTKPFKDNMDCGDGSGGKCSKSQIGGLLNKLTGGLFGDLGKLLNGALKALLSLANMGYDVGMCKVFQLVAQGLGAGNSLMSRGAAMLVGTMASKKNTAAIIDIAGSSAGLKPLLENPGMIGQAVSSFTLPKNVKGTGVNGFVDRFAGGMELFDTNWNKSSATSGMASIAKMGTTKSADFAKSLQSRAKTNAVDTGNLGSVLSNNFSAVSAAYKSSKLGSALNAFF